MQLANACNEIVSTPPRSTCLNPQLEKALKPINLQDFGNLMDVKLVQESNVQELISYIFCPNTTVVKLGKFENE